MPSLKRIDELTEGDHSFITKDSRCFYFIEYPSGNGDNNYNNPDYSYIHNFKKKMDRKGLPDWKYKEIAIQKTIDLFDSFFTRNGKIGLATLIPIPPSKVITDPLYDDRMTKVLNEIKKRHETADVRDIIITKKNMVSHETNQRPTIQEIQNNYTLEKNSLKGIRKRIILVDDVLTTGAHFCAAKNLILDRLPDASVRGIFIARRVLPDPFSAYDEDLDFL